MEVSIIEINRLEFREYTFHNSVYYCNCEGIILNQKFEKKKTFKGNDGYREVELSGNGINKNGNRLRYKVKVHTIVAELFVPKPLTEEKLEVNHKDFDRMNCLYTNLEWVTHLENIRYSVNSGRHYTNGFKGKNNPKSKLSENDVKEIRYNLSKKYTNIELAKMFGVCVTTISNIVNMKTWTQI